jgi:radical SAM superfamily enzyme YgiQ (UPF0313 family)
MRFQSSSEFDVLLVACEDEENLGVRYIASYLNAFGVTSRVVPFGISYRNRLLKLARTGKPEIVGFSLIHQRMLPDFTSLIDFLRRNGIKAHFTIGGHFPTIAPLSILRAIPGLDTVIRHEGEETMLELYQRLTSNGSLAAIKGLVYRKNGSTMSNPPRPLFSNLDCLPFPLRNQRIQKHRGIGVCSLIASRGCVHNCSFCSVRQFFREAPGQKRRSRTPENVVKEMVELHNRGIRVFIFKDDDLGCSSPAQRTWVRNFAEELRAKNLYDDILWRVSCRPDEVDCELFDELKDVGLRIVYMGIESGSNQGLKTFKKGFDVDEGLHALSTLRKLGLRYEYGFMLFDPDSTLETIRESIEFLTKAFGDGGATVRFTKMFPYAGTPIARRLDREGRLRGDLVFPDYDFIDPRVGLLEVFISQAFHEAFFGNYGVVRYLQEASFDCAILERFLADKYDTREYKKNIRKLTTRFNHSALDTMTMALRLMAESGYEEALGRWNDMEQLMLQEIDAQQHLKTELLDLTPKLARNSANSLSEQRNRPLNRARVLV